MYLNIWNMETQDEDGACVEEFVPLFLDASIWRKSLNQTLYQVHIYVGF